MPLTNERSADAVSAEMSRRGVIRVAGAGVLALGPSGAAAAAPAASAATRTSAGRVSEAPKLPAGFWNTFTSRYVNADGLRQHIVVYIDNLASVPGALLGSSYRSLDTTTAQNAQRATQKRIPVLAIGGANPRVQGPGTR